jgi:hypothetical protein
MYAPTSAKNRMQTCDPAKAANSANLEPYRRSARRWDVEGRNNGRVSNSLSENPAQSVPTRLRLFVLHPVARLVRYDAEGETADSRPPRTNSSARPASRCPRRVLGRIDQAIEHAIAVDPDRFNGGNPGNNVL